MKSIKIIAIAFAVLFTTTTFAQANNDGTVVNPKQKELNGPRAKNQKPGKRNNTIFFPVTTGTQVQRTGGLAKNTPVQDRELVNIQNTLTQNENLKGPKAKNAKHTPYKAPVATNNGATTDLASK